nr:hypothetical protein [uncultured Enterocloster sp.]
MEEKEDSIREATEAVNNWLEDEKLKARLWSLVNDWNSLCCQIQNVKDRVDAMEKDKINQEAKKSERLSNIALGVSAFVLAVIIFIEVVIKSGVK